MLVTYEINLVLLSVIVAMMASYTALDLASRVTHSQGRAARQWLLAGACAMGAGIWSMHFIGMLAVSLPIQLAYDLTSTLVSLLIAMVLSGYALSVVSRPTLPTRQLLTGGVVMGVGICAMHYTGMAAMRMSPPIRYDPLLFAVSVLIAIGASITALYLSFTLRAVDLGRVVALRTLSAIVMGLAISGMHYTGMAAAHFEPGAMCLAKNGFALGNVTMGYVIGGAVLSLLAVTLIVSIVDARMVSSTARMLRESEKLNAQLLAEITWRKLVEETLRESESRKSAILNTAQDAIVAMDHEGKVSDFNPAAEQIFGYRRADAVGKPLAELMIPERLRQRHYEGLARYLVTGEAPVLGRRIEMSALHADGREFPVELSINRIADIQPPAFTATLRDISERKHTEAALIEAKATAEKANLAKSDFLSSMSHELRTPLNAILGFAQLVESGSPAPTPSQKRSIDQILKGGWFLLELINEILDLALIESGKLKLSPEPASLAGILLECKAMIEPQAQERGISLTFPPECSYFVEADRIRLKQVLINLLANAIKYNKPAGAVVVECSPNPPDSIRISVRDTGAGLTAAQLAQLFQPFNRLGKETSAEEGTGIGLVMTKRLVELMGGAIGADSTIGTGSVFWIELSLTTAPQLAAPEAEHATPAPAQVPDGTPPRTLLYVEDNPANLQLVAQLLACRSDLRLHSAVDAKSGIEFARAHRPEVILMDISLPGISGVEALKILRADSSTAHIPIIAVSAYAMPHDIENGLAAGFFDYITKPIKINPFMNVLERALNFSQTTALKGSANVEPALVEELGAGQGR